MIEELRELAEWFRARGMADNADFLESVAVRLETPPAAIIGAKGGKASKRKIGPTQQAKMQAGRKLKICE